MIPWGKINFLSKADHGIVEMGRVRGSGEGKVDIKRERTMVCVLCVCVCE